MNNMKKIIVVLFIACFYQLIPAQDKGKYWEDIQTIKKYEKIYAPATNPIIFVGSSSIRRWDDVERTFASYRAINRGIGGAVISEITYSLNELVFQYHPRQIVIYAGENDLGDKASTADSICNRIQRLISAIRAQMPVVPIVYVSIKPSPVRDKVMDKAIEANKLIRTYLLHQKNIQYVDVFSLMLSADKKSRPELFLSDMLHMNPKGYKIWTKAIQPYLIK
jgi:lysophospholipase L1-like esterase